MPQRVEAWGNILEFPDGMSDADMAAAIRSNEAQLNPNAGMLTRVKSSLSNAGAAGLSMLTPGPSIADQAQAQSAMLADTAAPQVPGVPIRRDYYARQVAQTPQGAVIPDTGIVSRVRNIAAQDQPGQLGKRVVANAFLSTEPYQEEGGFIPSAVRTVGQNIAGLGQAAADYIPGIAQDNAVKRYGEALIEANPTAVNSLEDIAARPGKAVAEATGNAIPSMGAMVAANVVGQGIKALAPLTGPLAPLVAAAGQAVSWFGPAAIAALPSYNGIRDKQKLNDPKAERNARAIAIATLGAAAVGVIEVSFGPQQWALAAMTREGRAKLAAKFAATSIPGAYAKAVGMGMIEEGGEEIAQNPIEQLASGDNPLTRESVRDTLFGGAMGAIGGGVLGIGFPSIAGKPVNQQSDATLEYVAKRGGEKAKTAAQHELVRRAIEGIDPEIANKPESAPQAVERIINVAKEKAAETRATDALKSNVLQKTPPAAAPEAPQQAQAPKTGPSITQIVLPDGATLPAQWEVVDADTITATLKEGVNQPRDRSRAASNVQIQGIANNPDYRRLADSPVMDVGAPTLSSDGAIVGGNARFEGISRSYDEGKAADYLTSLKADAITKGIDPATIDAMKKPVLVRRITQPFDTRTLAVASNTGTSMQYSGLELAKIDAQRMKGLADLDVTDTGDIALTGQNLQNVRNSLSGYNAAELGALVDKDGQLSQEGIRRIRNAMLYTAYGDSPTLARMVESTDNDLRNITGALVKAAGTVAKVRSDIAAGSIPAELDISENLVAAVEELSKIKSMGMTADQYLAQIGMFEGGLNETEADIVRTLEGNIRSQKKIADFIKGYYESIAGLDLTTGEMFGQNIPAKTELLKNAKERITEKPPTARDLFANRKAIAQGPAEPGYVAGAEGGIRQNQAEYGLNARKATYNPNQREFNYDAIETRPGTTERQLEIGRSVYAERIRAVVDRAHGSLLGAAIAKDFQEHGGSELVGKTVKSPEDLAILAQIFRDPRFETFRIFFTKKGQIVHHTGLTSRMPASVSFVFGKETENWKDARAKVVAYLSEQKRLSGADGYYLLHNHPNGPAIPSQADMALTIGLAKELPGFLGHVVIDDNQYGVIDKKGLNPKHPRANIIQQKLTGGYSGEAAIPHNALQALLTSPESIAQLGKLIERKKGFFSVIGLSPQLEVVAIADVPMSILKEKNVTRLYAMLRAFARNSGSNHVAVISETPEVFEVAVRHGVLLDVVNAKDSSSLRSLGFEYGGNKLFAQNVKSFLVEQTPGVYQPTTFDSPEQSRLDDLIHVLQDKHIDLKRVTESIQSTGKQITDEINPYLQETLFHGRSAERVKLFLNKELNPLIQVMRVNGTKMADFEEYLWARHAQEYNAQIAKVNPDMPDGGSGMTTQEAQTYLANLDPKTKALYEAMAQRVDEMTKKSRQTLVNYGLESQATIDAWEKAYKHYVPLMREDMEHGRGTGTGQGFSVKGNASKRATGSKRAVVDILANIAQQRERYIIRGEKNRVATALIGLAVENPNPDFWKIDTPPTTRTVNKTTGLVETRIDPLYKSRENVIVARIPDAQGNVQERSIVFNEHDPRAERMALALKNLDQDQLGVVLAASSSLTRYYASINTQYNPVFGLVNLMRDIPGAMLNLSSTPLAGRQGEVLRRTGPALLAIYQSLRGERKGKVIDNEYSRGWADFQSQGGQTGYRDMFRNAKERAAALERALNPDWWQTTKTGEILTAGGLLNVPEKIIVDKAVRPMFELLSDYNDAMENAVRLSAYMTGLDHGMSKAQAAALAKNSTVNFNRRGSMGRQIGSLYAFFNASVQGTARLAETLKGPAGKRIVLGGILLGGMQAMLLSMAGFDDDEPPEFIKARSFVFPVGEGKYITVPMPLGFNVLPNLGRLVTEFALSGFKEPAKHVGRFLDAAMEAFNPIGNAGMSLQTVLPTAADPFGALAENKDWTGKPIARQDYNAMNPTPGFTRSKDTATNTSKLLAEGINAITGGNQYQPGLLSPTPDQLDYLIAQATGGVGREAMKIEQFVSSRFTGEELPAHKVPVLSRFYGDTRGSASQDAKFYDHLKHLNGIEAEIKGRIKDKADVAAFKAEHPEWKLIGSAKATDKIIKELRERSRRLERTHQPGSADLKKQIEARRKELMTRFNDRYRETVPR